MKKAKQSFKTSSDIIKNFKELKEVEIEETEKIEINNIIKKIQSKKNETFRNLR